MIWILLKLIFKIYFTGQPQFPSLLSSHLLPYPPPIHFSERMRPLMGVNNASHMIGILQWYFSLKETGLLLNVSWVLQAIEQVEDGGGELLRSTAGEGAI